MPGALWDVVHLLRLSVALRKFLNNSSTKESKHMLRSCSIMFSGSPKNIFNAPENLNVIWITFRNVSCKDKDIREALWPLEDSYHSAKLKGNEQRKLRKSNAFATKVY